MAYNVKSPPQTVKWARSKPIDILDGDIGAFVPANKLTANK